MNAAVLSRLRYLNVGCGRRLHPDWTNVDLTATAPGVIAADVRLGIPFSNGTFQAVYHSHVLEHFAKQDAPGFLRECRRVLAPGGVIRVAVPDLEHIARLYLEKLEASLRGEPGASADYDWMMLELYDQTVREFGGGEMFRHFVQAPSNLDFIRSRMGAEADAVEAVCRTISAPQRTSLLKKALMLLDLTRIPGRFRRLLARVLLGDEGYQALQIGQFRRSGEVHQWMYDRWSLARLLGEIGFAEARVVSATESRIPGWTSFCLDADVEGRPHKPDSLYLEAIRSA